MPSSSTRVSTLLADLASALEEVGARWYLFGAQASILHGASRLTADVDVTVDLTGTARRDVLAAPRGQTKTRKTRTARKKKTSR